MRSFGKVAGLALFTAVGCHSEIDGPIMEPPFASFAPDDTRPTVEAQTPPPPISGGTLVISHDGRTAIAADSDHDLVWRVDLRAVGDGLGDAVLSATVLEPGDEPGRVVEDALGRIHVVLRRGGAIASFEPSRPQEVQRTPVCNEPRGLAYDASTDRLHVACTNGQLVTLPAGGGPEVRRVQLDADLRDVVVQGDRLLVSRFRSAEVLVVGADGAVAERIALPEVSIDVFGDPDGEMQTATFRPAVAWRMVEAPDGSVEIAHQRGTDRQISIEQTGGYGGGFDCAPPIVQSATSRIAADGVTAEASTTGTGVVLPVDAAVSPEGNLVAVASAGTRGVQIAERDGGTDEDPCESFNQEWSASTVAFDEARGRQPVAVAWRDDHLNDGETQLVVQLRDPAAIVRVAVTGATLGASRIELLPAPAVTDSGHQSFHEAARAAGGPDIEFIAAPLACASCHPEGREDARTWNFAEIGPRRTQSVSGGILGTEPLHWDGDMDHFGTLMDDVFVNRMGGPRPNTRRVSIIARWIDSLPAPRPGFVVDGQAADRGRGLFEDEDVGCTGCHGGRHLTDNLTHQVGTDGAFQAPSLVGVSARAPYLHDGRAATLRDRFAPTGGGDRHGHTSQLTASQIDDLVAYLETL